MDTHSVPTLCVDAPWGHFPRGLHRRHEDGAREHLLHADGRCKERRVEADAPQRCQLVERRQKRGAPSHLGLDFLFVAFRDHRLLERLDAGGDGLGIFQVIKDERCA